MSHCHTSKQDLPTVSNALQLVWLTRAACSLCFSSQPVLESYGGLSQYKLRQAIEYIDAHLDQEITLTDLAEVLGMSQYYFCRLFKQSMTIPPYQYVLQQRVERAKQLLQQPEVAICDIALECGFANQSHLTKHFRKLTGITPKAYRNTLGLGLSP
jgi:AraC family transcriptional regulator